MLSIIFIYFDDMIYTFSQAGLRYSSKTLSRKPEPDAHTSQSILKQEVIRLPLEIS
jgi:hypothetical protein